MKLKSFFKALIWRINLISVPNSMVCLPFVQLTPSRNSGTGTLRDWVDEPRYGLESGPPKVNSFGYVGDSRLGKTRIDRTRPAENWLIRFADLLNVHPTE